MPNQDKKDKLTQILTELVCKYIPHDGVYCITDISQACSQIEALMLTEMEIEKVLKGLAEKQLRAVIKAVDKKGLLKTGWEDIDEQGGHLDFEVIATALYKAQKEKMK